MPGSRRVSLPRISLFVVALLLVAAGAPRAFAVDSIPCTPYPGCLGQSNAQPTFATQDLGDKPIGSTFDVSFCQFQVGVLTTSTFNGQPADEQRPGPNGCVTKNVEILPGLNALGVGRHLLAATGLAQGVATARVRINGRLFDGGPLGSQETLIVQGVGINGAARTVTVTFRIVRAARTTTGLARTGSNALRWSPVGLGLLGLGYLLMLSTRRRRATT